MANHTISIANTLDLLGADPATLWGNTGVTTMTWGTDKWGSGSEDMNHVVMHVVEDTLTSTTGFIKDIVFNGPIADTLTMSSSMNMASEFILGGDTLTMSSDVTIEYLTNGIWYVVFPGGVTNAESRISTTYTTPTDGSTTYATPSTPSTTWS